MTIVWSIPGIFAFGFLINILLKQIYNFVFFLGEMPWVWIGISGVIALAAWGVSALFQWNISTPAWASALALFWNMPPRGNSAEARSLVDEMYREIGVKHGRLLYRFGLIVFVVCALTACGSSSTVKPVQEMIASASSNPSLTNFKLHRPNTSGRIWQAAVPN